VGTAGCFVDQMHICCSTKVSNALKELTTVILVKGKTHQTLSFVDSHAHDREEDKKATIMSDYYYVRLTAFFPGQPG